jgi:hypothetical protein
LVLRLFHLILMCSIVVAMDLLVLKEIPCFYIS